MTAEAKLHPIETVNVPGCRGQTLNMLVGCEHGCEIKTDCWARPLAKRMKCPKCRAFVPHTHFERARGIAMFNPHCYFQDMAEPNHFSGEDIEQLQGIYKSNHQHIFQLLTHFPLEFYTNYSTWSKNVWCMGTFTQGAIEFPSELQGGLHVAYCEPVMGKLWPCGLPPDLIVIGLLNHSDYAQHEITLGMLASWIKDLMAPAYALGIPIFIKNKADLRWSQMGIEPIQEWPK